MAKNSDSVDGVKASLRAKSPVSAPEYSAGLSSGSTMINLACTGRPGVAYLSGTYVLLVGDSNSGKTWLGMSALAEAAHSSAYNKHRLIYDNGEDGANMNVGRYFGRATADRLEPPAVGPEGAPLYSMTIEDFYFNLDECFRTGPCVYVMDSMDSLSSESEEAKFIELKKARKKEKDTGEEQDVAGSYGDGKAKKNSSLLRRALARLRTSGSVLIVLSQTRDNIKKFSFDPRTRSGGRALSFYAQSEIWSRVKQKEEKTIRGNKSHVGNLCEFHVRRTRYNGHEAKVEVPIYHSHGIDDTGSMVDYLTKWKHWTASGKTNPTVSAPEFGFDGKREVLIRRIEEAADGPAKLRSLAAMVWCEVEEESAVRRAKRYE